MNEYIRKQHQWICSLAVHVSVYTGIVKSREWMAWVNHAAGIGVNEQLGYGLAGWWYWIQDHSFCKLLMTGLSSPHMYRISEIGKQKIRTTQGNKF